MTTDLATLQMLEPFHSPALQLKNRIVLAPMTRSRAAADGTAVPIMAEYYRQRATAGLLVAEATSISSEGIGYISIPGIYTQAQVESWQQVTEAVHQAGSRIFLQLLHGGRIGHSSLSGRQPVAPSAIRAEGITYTQAGPTEFETPRALTEADIARIVQDYAAAACNAIAAGFDGVEIHGANGYLPNQFLSDATNHRTDGYGGSIEGRCRFALEVTEAVAAAIGWARTALRLSPLNQNNGAVHTDPLGTYGYLIGRLSGKGLAYLHLMEGDAHKTPPGLPLEMAAYFRPAYQGTLIASGGLTRDSAEQMLAQGTADLVAFGAPFIANPDLPARFRLGAPLAEPDRHTYYTGGSRGYIDYPALAW